MKKLKLKKIKIRSSATRPSVSSYQLVPVHYFVTSVRRSTKSRTAIIKKNEVDRSETIPITNMLIGAENCVNTHFFQFQSSFTSRRLFF